MKKLNKVEKKELKNVTGGAYAWEGNTNPRNFRCKESEDNCSFCGERIEWFWQGDKRVPDQVWDCGLGRIPLRDGDGEPPERYDK